MKRLLLLCTILLLVLVPAFPALGEASQGQADDYSVPGKLEKYPMSPVFSLYGELYRLPCPLAAFADNGWVLGDSFSDPDSPNLLYGNLTREEGTLTVYLVNAADREGIDLSQASVGGISGKTEPGMLRALTLSGDIRLGIREVEFRRLVPKLVQKQAYLAVSDTDPGAADATYTIYDYQTAYGTELTIRFTQSPEGWRTADYLDFHLG